MMTPDAIDMYAREIQRDRLKEAAMDAQTRGLAPGLFDRLIAALRRRQAERPKAVRPVKPVAEPTTLR